jgi:hypothetical protein
MLRDFGNLLDHSWYHSPDKHISSTADSSLLGISFNRSMQRAQIAQKTGLVIGRRKERTLHPGNSIFRAANYKLEIPSQDVNAT